MVKEKKIDGTFPELGRFSVCVWLKRLGERQLQNRHVKLPGIGAAFFVLFIFCLFSSRTVCCLVGVLCLVTCSMPYVLLCCV